MNNRIVNSFFFVLLSIFCVISYALPVCKTEGFGPFGARDCGEGTVESLHVAGPLTMHGTTVDGSVTVNGKVYMFNSLVRGKTKIVGQLTATASRLGLLELNGHARLINTTIRRAARIDGNMYAEGTTFEKPLSIAAVRTELEKTKTRNIFIRRIDASTAEKPRRQLIRLEDHTTVRGNVQFRQQNGVVQIDSTSKVTGKIIGGRLMPID